MIYLSLTLGLISTCMGLLVLAGYLLGIPWLYGPFRASIAMAPNTAIAITCLGVAHVLLILHAPRWLIRRDTLR